MYFLPLLCLNSLLGIFEFFTALLIYLAFTAVKFRESMSNIRFIDFMVLSILLWVDVGMEMMLYLVDVYRFAGFEDGFMLQQSNGLV